MSEIVTALFICGLAILWTKSRPTTTLLRLFMKEEDYDGWNRPKQWLYELLTCPYCMAVWIGIPIDIQSAVIASLFAYIVDQL